ncbi:MAG: CDP-alcohol phosphatidyltransferase family protein [Acidobacteriota bacterium]|nr:CDP-alcohol phosphatidyltransferase family protein [Acidobacteriota bacterium]
MTWTSALTAANQLTLLRVLLVPPFVLTMLYGMYGWALITFLIAALTDMLDGLAARMTGQQTTLGAWLDPMADKLLIFSMVVVLTLPSVGPNRLPLWLTVLVISRDIAIIATVAVINLAVGRRTFKPSALGKAATAVFLTTGVAILIANYIGRPMPIVSVFIYTSLAITLASSIDYIFKVARVIREH